MTEKMQAEWDSMSNLLITDHFRLVAMDMMKNGRGEIYRKYGIPMGDYFQLLWEYILERRMNEDYE